MKIELDENNVSSGIAGLSIHKIETVWNGVFQGCTDATAINYNSDAVIGDGSCVYQTTTPPSSSTSTYNYRHYEHKGVSNGWDYYRIIWDFNNNPDDKTDWIYDYENKIHEHTYTYGGDHRIKVETKDVYLFFGETKKWVFDKTVNSCSMEPILQLLLD